MKHCKKLCALLAAALLCMALTLPAGAAAPLVRDECGVFDADTLADLEEQAESASDGHDVDVYFLVVDDIGDADQRDYAKNYYISNGLGYGDEQSGILFLLAVGSRKYVTITYGEGVTAFTDYRIEQLEAEIATLTAAMNDPAFYQRDAAAITAHGASLQATQAALDAAYLRWTELDA